MTTAIAALQKPAGPGIWPAPAARAVVLHGRGRRHGPVVRLVSPSDVGELLKPFVFLDHAQIEWSGRPLMGIHPHSGIATLTVVLEGGMAYEDTTGKQGEIRRGGLEWMQAGNGVWHDGDALPGEPLRAFQLWIALPPGLENAPPESQYIAPEAVPREGPARVLLGQYGSARSLIRAPGDLNYFHVTLKDGEPWRYVPPAGHTVAWLAVDRGRLQVAQTVDTRELVVFEEAGKPIEARAEGSTSFVIGSARKHPHSLVLGNYSVHTSAAALTRGEEEIGRIGRLLRAAGRLDGMRSG